MLRKADGTTVRDLDINPGVPAVTRTPRAVRSCRSRPATASRSKAELLLPHDLDVSGNTLYPVWLSTYGGPHFPTLSDVYRPSRGMNNELVSEGFIVFRMDPRSASGKGAISAWSAYRKLGVQELEDIKDALAWLKERPYVDGTRIGMSGHSYGGYLTAFCLTHSDLFAAGIAGAPVTDWRDYDSIYTERFMDTPQNNPEGYEASSVVEGRAQAPRPPADPPRRDRRQRLGPQHHAPDPRPSAGQQGFRADDLSIHRHGIFRRSHYTRSQFASFIEHTLGGPRAASGGTCEVTSVGNKPVSSRELVDRTGSGSSAR